MAGAAVLVLAVLLGGCVGIPTGGGVTTDEIDAGGTDDGLVSLPPGPADGAASEVDEVPIGGKPVATRILTHGRYRDPITEHGIPNGKRVEESHG